MRLQFGHSQFGYLLIRFGIEEIVMVKVIKEEDKERTRCERCNSLLEFSRQEDVKKGEKLYTTYDFLADLRDYKYIECPVCGNKTEVI